MVSAGVCFDGKQRLHFIPDKTKVNAKLCVETLLPERTQECRSVLPSGFIFQQDVALAHMTKLAQDWIATKFQWRRMASKFAWPTMSGKLCLNATSHFNASQRTSMSSRKFCSWYGTSCHKIRSRKPYWASGRLQACVKAGDGHFKHTLKWTTCQIVVFVITVNVSWQWQ